MGSTSRICIAVIDGNTIVTNKRARSSNANELLESLILGQFITYDIVAIGARRREVEALAEVWLDDKSVNDAMRAADYQEPSAQMHPSLCATKTEEPTTKA